MFLKIYQATGLHSVFTLVMPNYTNFSANVNFWPITAEETSAGLTKGNLDSEFPPLHVKRYGAKGDASTDDLIAINNAVAVAAIATAGSTQGATVSFGQGAFMVSGPVVVPNRVTLVGSSPRGSVIKATTGFTGGSFVVQFINGTSAMFDTGLKNIGVNANLVTSTGCVQHNAFQEHSVMERVIVERFTTTGLDIINGYGGAARATLKDFDCLGETGATGIHVDVPGLILKLDGVTVAERTGSLTLTKGIDIGGVFAVLGDMVHFERCVDGFYLNDAASRLIINGCVSGDSDCTNIIRVLSNNQTVIVNGLVYPNGATRTIYNGTISETGILRNYVWPPQMAFTDDATPDISSAGGCPRNIILNGTTTLTGFDGVQDGWFWMTELNGAISVTDSATLVVHGGTLTGANGDGLFCWHSNGVTFAIPCVL